MDLTDEQIGAEAAYNARQETVRLLQEKGPKLEKILLRLRQSLNAQETKIVKLKGAVNQNDLPKGFRLIANTGIVLQNDDGNQFGNGESLIAYDLIAHGHRLRAIDLALQLHDAMPSQKHELTGKDGGPIETKEITNFPKEPETIEEWEKQVRAAEKSQADDEENNNP